MARPESVQKSLGNEANISSDSPFSNARLIRCCVVWMISSVSWKFSSRCLNCDSSSFLRRASCSAASFSLRRRTSRSEKRDSTENGADLVSVIANTSLDVEASSAEPLHNGPALSGLSDVRTDLITAKATWHPQPGFVVQGPCGTD